MRKILLITLVGSAFASAATYKLDPHHSNVRFQIDHFGTSTNSAGIYGLEGKVELDTPNKKGRVEVTIPLANINSGSKDFDKHLKSADIFNVAKNPSVKFKSTAFEFTGEKVKAVKGELTMNGKTKPLTLEATKFNCYDSPMLKTQVCGGDFTATIDRSDWGVDYLIDQGMAKEVKILIQVEAAADDKAGKAAKAANKEEKAAKKEVKKDEKKDEKKAAGKTDKKVKEEKKAADSKKDEPKAPKKDETKKDEAKKEEAKK